MKPKSHTEETAVSPIGNFNCIVSNPPYIMNKEKATMEANVLENEPHMALFVPDDDPLLFYRAIAASDKGIWWKAGIFTSRSTPFAEKRP